MTFLIGNFVSKNGNERRPPFTRKTAKFAKTEKDIRKHNKKAKQSITYTPSLVCGWQILSKLAEVSKSLVIKMTKIGSTK